MWINKNWNKRTKDPGYPTIIKAIESENNGIAKDQVIAFKSGDTNTTNTAELVNFDVVNNQVVGDTHIWKIGEVFHNNEYVTIKHYTGKALDKFQDTGRYLTANGQAQPTVIVKQSKKICYLGFHIINYLK